jgi:rsbT co-antagonist protein RsbR
MMVGKGLGEEMTTTPGFALYEALPEPIAVCDARGTLHATNSAWRALHHDAPGLSIAASLDSGAQDGTRLLAALAQVASLAGQRRVIGVFGRVAGRQRFFELTATSIAAPAGPEPGAPGVFVVVPHHSEDQNEDAALGARLSEGVLEQWPHMIFIKEAADLRFVYGNKVCEELFGMPRSEFLGKNDYDFFPADQADFFTARDRDVFNERRMIVIPEEPVHSPKMGRRLLRTWKYPIFNEQGEPAFLVGVSEDITERRAGEIELKEAYDRLHVIAGEREQAAYAAQKEAEAKTRLLTELDQKLSIIGQQHAQILALSAPILDVAARVVAVPLIGALDAERGSDVTQRLLSAVVERAARYVIVDVTGLTELDTDSAGQLVRMLRAVGLLGASGVVTGIRPNVARTLVQLGADLSGLSTLRDLSEALVYCVRRLGSQPA